MQNHYAILSLPQTASQEQIRSVWRTLALRLHPDKNHGVDTKEAFQRALAAYEVLRGEGRRAQYDLRWREEFGGQEEMPDSGNLDESKAMDDRGRDEERGGDESNVDGKQQWESMPEETHIMDEELLKQTGRQAQDSRRQKFTSQQRAASHSTPNLTSQNASHCRYQDESVEEHEEDQTKRNSTIARHRMGKSATTAHFQRHSNDDITNSPIPSHIPKSYTHAAFGRPDEDFRSPTPSRSFSGQQAQRDAHTGSGVPNEHSESPRTCEKFKAQIADEYFARLGNYRDQRRMQQNRIRDLKALISAAAAEVPHTLKERGTFKGLLRLRRRPASQNTEIRQKMGLWKQEAQELRRAILTDRQEYESLEHHARTEAAIEALSRLNHLRPPTRQMFAVYSSREAWLSLKAVTIPSSLSNTPKRCTDEISKCECDTVHDVSERFTGVGTCERCEKLVFGKGVQCWKCRMVVCRRYTDVLRLLKEYETWLAGRMEARSRFFWEGF